MMREVMTVAGHVQIFVGIEAELTPPWVGEKWRISFVHPLYLPPRRAGNYREVNTQETRSQPDDQKKEGWGI